MVAAASAVEGEDPRRRRGDTDCVFFLASPFACTKRSKCEYRHAEGARFNRRNCWYWFQGNCVNPSCTFRHPSLENFNRTKSIADPVSSYCSTSVKAANPCYFYYNSHCSKGDKCPFFHEPLTSNDVGDEIVEESKEALANTCQDTSCHIKEAHVSSNPEFDEAKAVSSAFETSTDMGEYMKYSTVSDQSSGDSMMDHTEQDERRDSSHGFDVLVDDCLSYKSDLEHQLAKERVDKVLNAEYDVGDPVQYDMYYHDSEYYNYEQEWCAFDDRHGCAYLGHTVGVQEHESEITLGHIPQTIEVTSDGYDRRFFDSRKFTSSVADTGFVHQHTQFRHISKRKPENRKGAKGKKDCIKRSLSLEPKNGPQQIESTSTHHKNSCLMGECPRPAVRSTFRQKKRRRGKQCHVPSARSSEHPAADFTVPKTLAQIKEKKCKSNSSFSHPTSCIPRSFTDNFEGPKSLSELLKTKGRTFVGK
ncbi:hypothetical protein GUJ93_ZPchr0005g14921 [Zizania palustris]|uniref:C3H1-type domain-containing protein n=1 Tax=Zizania palustris TaxID=103762 RepID=A0A8J5SR74_ZIZPA|nr:hypothetical protein GUJ93_ZPchr0005g14921 [Zizania palustris]